uniref:Uncharacterized protein n=1 Tax=viral metagenome TaxID=1070528 RepID=A0A6C0LW02_9ZZZZ
MGAGKSSLVKKNEVINWSFKKEGWFTMNYSLPDIILKGDIVLRNQTEEEGNKTIDEIQHDTKDILKSNQIIGKFSSKKGNLTIKSVYYDNEENIIFEITHNNGIKYLLNLNRQDSTWSDEEYKVFLQYAFRTLYGNSKLIVSELCQKTNSLNFNCNPLVGSNNNVNKGSNIEINGFPISITGGGYEYITNPETGRKVNVNGKIGKKVINTYLMSHIGGSVGFIVDKAELRNSFLFSILGADYKNKWEQLSNIPYITNINDNLDHMFIQLFESLGGEYEAMNFFKKTIEEEWVANDNEWRNNWIGVLIGIIVVSVVEKEDVSVEGFEFLQDKNIIDELGNMIESPENPFNFINEYLENNFPEQLIDAMDY